MLELYRFQAEEIDRINPAAKEFEDLQAEHRRLANLERLRQLAGQAAAILGEGEEAALDSLRQASAALAEMARLDGAAGNLQRACDEALAGLNELSIDVARYVESLDLDPGRLEWVEARIEQIQRLCRKYGQTVEDVLAHRRRIGEDLKRLETLETDFGHLDAQIAAARDKYMRLARRLSQGRRQASAKLARAVMAELAELGMDKAVCEVQLQEAPPGPSGVETVEFMISANPGLPLRPLRQVASGGELSRTMLAMKSVLSADARCSVLVFDEVDANVGGRMGSVIGRKAGGAGAAQPSAMHHAPAADRGLRRPAHGGTQDQQCQEHADGGPADRGRGGADRGAGGDDRRQECDGDDAAAGGAALGGGAGGDAEGGPQAGREDSRAAKRIRRTFGNCRMTKIERVMRELSDLRDFYVGIQRMKRLAQQGDQTLQQQGQGLGKRGQVTGDSRQQQGTADSHKE